MANITKAVAKNIPGAQRYQVWQSSENADDATSIAAGDVFRIKDSLGKTAKTITFQITGASDLSIRLNSRQTIYPRQYSGPESPFMNGDFYDNMAQGVEVLNYSSDAIIIGGTATLDWTWNKEIAISDIEIVTWSTGTFQLIVS